MKRPAETIAGSVGTAVGLIFAVLHTYGHWDLDASLQPYVPVVVGWIAASVTWFVARSQRAGGRNSAADGKVGKP